MVDQDLALLASDIRALSTFLNEADFYWWPSASIPDPPGGMRNLKEGLDTKYFSHISTLLGFCTDVPIAVTGTITKEHVIATIVCPSRPESRQQEPGEELKVKDSRSVAPSSRTLGEVVKNTPQGLEGYVADLIDLFRMVQSGEITGPTIIQWVIYRGWFKLHSQLKRSETDFEDDLFGLMEAWSPDFGDRIEERMIDMPVAQPMHDRYSYLTVDRTDEGVKFLLNKTTAPVLVKTIARIFTNIRETIADPDMNRSDASYSLVNSFIWLHGVLANRYVQAVITETSLRVALYPKWPERPGHKPGDCREALPGPDSMHYGLRYLRMLVVCTTSVMRLNDREILPLVAATRATIISLSPPPCDAESERGRVAQMVIGEIARDVPAEAAWLKFSSEWIGRLADINIDVSEEQNFSSPCLLHAEAGLMAVACEARLSRSDRDAADEYGSAFVNLTRTPIGTSGKCCPLCLRLMQLLNAHFASLGDPEALVFSLTETHGKVLPWDPPQFGIPKAVLTQLRDELWEKLVQEAIEVGKRRAPEVDRSPYYDLLAVQGAIPLPAGIEW